MWSREDEIVAAIEGALRSGQEPRLRSVLDAARSLNDGTAASYLEGRILAALGDMSRARDCFAAALSRNPAYSPALYSLGLLEANGGRMDIAISCWEGAVRADPTHVDALYNLAQACFDADRFAEARDYWTTASRLCPNDLEIRKKVVQALHAVGDFRTAGRELADLMRAVRESPDPNVQAVSEFVIDQLRVNGGRALAFALVRPRGSDLSCLYQFRVFDSQNTVVLTAQLESSAYAREAGTPFVMGINTSGGHRTTGPAFETEPDYETVRSAAIALIHQYSPSAASASAR